MLRNSKYMCFTYLFKCLYFRMFRYLLGRVPVVVHVHRLVNPAADHLHTHTRKYQMQTRRA
jgi:hypothetical protein